MELNEILQIALRASASDIHLKAGLPPMFRIDGALMPLKEARRLPPEEVARMASGIMNEFQKERFKQTNEVDLAYGVPGLGRFRVNVFQQRGTVGCVLRVIPCRMAPAWPERPPPFAFTKTSSLPIWSTSFSGSTRIIFEVSRPKYWSSVRPLMTMLPVPGERRTRATDSLRRPTEIWGWAISIPRYSESFSGSGFCATCGCSAPA